MPEPTTAPTISSFSPLTTLTMGGWQNTTTLLKESSPLHENHEDEKMTSPHPESPSHKCYSENTFWILPPPTNTFPTSRCTQLYVTNDKIHLLLLKNNLAR